MATTSGRNGNGHERKWTEEDWNDLYHTGPDTLSGKYMRLFWQPVQRSDELAPGKAKPVRIMSDDLTVYRAQDGTPHVVDFRCAHRRTQLSIGWVEGDNIRCRYHGWVYGPTGQCVEQPGEPEPFCERIRIRGFPTQEYLGLIFAYLGEGEPPPLPRYPDFEGPGLREVLTYTRHCNYFNSIDNDGIHVYFVHRSPGRDWRNWNGKIPQSTPIETEYGFGSVGSRRGSEGTARGMPNISFRIATDQYTTLHDAPRMDHLAWRVPVDDETHVSFNVALVHAYTDEEVRKYREWQAEFQALGVSEETEVGLIEQTLAGELDYDSVDLPTEALITYQDHVTQQGQGAIPDHENEHLGRTDASVILRRKAQSRELRALAEGRPLKQWLPPSRAAGITRGEEQQTGASVAP